MKRLISRSLPRLVVSNSRHYSSINLSTESIIADDDSSVWKCNDADRKAVVQRVTETLLSKFNSEKAYTMGYQINLDLASSPGVLSDFLGFHINNCGDPLEPFSAPVQSTMHIERHLLHLFAELQSLPHTEMWGAVLAGSTVGNLQGLWMARLRLPNAPLICSEMAHYSVLKTASLLRMETRVVASDAMGRICVDELEKTIRECDEAILLLTNGITMTGACDNVEAAVTLLRDRFGSEVLSKTHVHVDAALGGLVLPFLDNAPIVDFRLPEVSTSTCSVHKQLGSTVPAAVFLARQSIKRATVDLNPEIEYVLSRDTTVTGSRDGFSVLAAWCRLHEYGYEGLRHLATTNVTRAQHLHRSLIDAHIPSHVAPFGLCVWFPLPAAALVAKYHLATYHSDRLGAIAHMYVMPHVTDELLEEFVEDMRESVVN